jgi:PhnB protein
MISINPYINFKGNAEQAFNFYKSVFGGEFAFVQKFGEGPQSEKVKPEDREKIMHISLPIGKNVLMASDAIEFMGGKTTFGDNFSISLSVDSKAEADRIFNALSKGGKIDMPMGNMFWGDYFGMITDKFGIPWMISFSEERNKQ